MTRIRRAAALAAALSVALLASCGGNGGGGGDTGNGNASASGSGTGGNNAPVTRSITGTVADKLGAPVAGVTITLFHHNDHTSVTTTSGADGRWRIDGVTTGPWSDTVLYAEKAGYGIDPVAGDAAATVTRFDFNGLYRRVIRLVTMPDRDVANADFTALRSGERLVSLARTGATVSHAAGDDADAARGVAWPGARFHDNADGTITDTLTGLVWLKDAGCVAPTTWATALAAARTLASGQCGLTDASTAGQWRMPNANELESLVDVAEAAPAVSAGHPFLRIDLAHAYWTSTTYMAATSYAMAIRFSDGRWINGTDPSSPGFDNTKSTAANGLWAVRADAAGTPGAVRLLATGVYPGIGGGSFGAGDDASVMAGVPLTSPRFVDNGDGTLSDTMTGLVWLKRGDCIQADWAGALAAIGQLASGQCGLADGSSAGQWRLPNRTEMLSLADRAPTFAQAAYYNGQYGASGAVVGPVIFDTFVVSAYYWTSTTDAADPTRAWTIYSCDFGVYDIAKSDLRYALAVR